MGRWAGDIADIACPGHHRRAGRPVEVGYRCAAVKWDGEKVGVRLVVHTKGLGTHTVSMALIGWF